VVRVQHHRKQIAVHERDLAQSTSALKEFEKSHDRSPKFTPAVQPPAPNEVSGDLSQKAAPRCYHQLAFF
jgi:hypothetical protein